MNWDAIAAIAELLAAIGVIVSLIFVGLQVKKSNAEARAATMQATTDTEMSMMTTFATHAAVWNKVNTGIPLEGSTEERIGILLFNHLMVDYENRFHHFHAGFFDRRSWDSRVTILRKLVTLPIYGPWRQSLGGQSRGADYLDFLDDLAEEVRGES